MKKRWIALVLAAAVTMAGFTGCGNNSDSEGSSTGGSESSESADEMKIGVSIFNKDQFFANQEKEMLAYAENFPGLEITSFDAQNDMQKQQEQITTFASQNYDAVILSAVNTDTAAELIDMAGDRPMIFTNRLPDEGVFREGLDAYVGSDENESGKLQGEYLAEYYKDSGKTELNVVILMGQLGLDNTTKRTASAKQALEDAGYTLNIVFEDTAEWDRATAMSKMEQVLGTGKPIDCVIANNDEMALGAIEALKSVDRLKDVQVVGLDATDNALQSIKDGEMAMTVFQNAKAQAEKAIDVAMAAANGEDFETFNWIPFTAITKDNVDEYID